MPANGNNRINFQVGFNVDKASLNQIQQAFKKIQDIKPADFSGTRHQLVNIKRQALDVSNALNKAFNPNLNSINLSAFKKQLGNLSMNKIYQDFNKLGAVGQNAFNSMSTSILTTNLNLKQTSNFIQNMGTTLMNTAKWTVASGAIRAFTSSISQAFSYVKSLDSSLNDIRIVTKDSADEMANFAAQANRAATELGRSTLDYTKAALTFYQQGLSDEDVQVRTEATLKAQNITGAGSEMADYLTAVWNGYKVANEQAELYVDKLAAVADSSASNMSQLAVAMSKVASTANMLGVPVDKLNAQIATIVATTRQAPESVGNALKTIYARINDIATGADDAEISLGNYSKKMLEVGISVLDANGRLRDTGDVIDEIGGKWNDLSRQQQIYLARTMAGQRQYNNLLALFENWSNYTDLVNVSLESQGATAEKNSIYLESLAAHMEQLGAAQQRLKSSMVDTDSYKDLIDIGTQGVTLLANFIQSIGGGGNALLMLGSIFTQVFSGTIAKEINGVITNMRNVRENVQIVKNAIAEINRQAQVGNGSLTASRQLQSIKDLYGSISSEQREYLNNLLVVQTKQENQVNLLKQQKQQAEALRDKMVQAMNITPDENWGNFAEQLNIVDDNIKAMQPSLKRITNNFNALRTTNTFNDLKDKILAANDALGGSNQKLNGIAQKLSKITAGTVSGWQDTTVQRYVTQIKQAIQSTKDQLNTVNPDNIDQINQKFTQAQQAAKNAAQATARFKEALRSQANIQGLVKGVAGLGQVASGIKSIINLTQIWNNENLSTGEKFLQTITSISMGLGMLVNGFSQLSQGGKALKNIILAYGNMVAKRNAATQAAVQETVANVGSATANTAVATTAKAATQAQGEKSAANVTEAGTAKLAESANIGLASSFGLALKAAAPYIAILAAIGGAIYAFIQWSNAGKQAVEESAEAAKLAKDQYIELKNTYTDLNNSIDKYNTLKQQLEDLQRNTEQWNNKVRESNELVLGLIQKFPILIDYIKNTNGVLGITDQGFRILQQKMQEALRLGSFVSLDTSTRSDNAATNYQAQQLLNSYQVYSHRNSQGQYRDTSNTSEGVLEAIKIYNDFLNGKLDEQIKSDSELASYIAENSSASLGLAQYLLENTSQLKALGQSIEKNTKIDQLNRENTVRDYYQSTQNSDYSLATEIDKAIITKIGAIDFQNIQDELVKSWREKLDEPVRGNNASRQEWGADVLKAIETVTGKNYSWSTQNEIIGGGQTRQFAFREAGAASDTIFDVQYIASLMAAQEAMNQLGVSAADTTKILQNLDSQIRNKDVQSAVRELISGNKDFSSFTKQQLTEFQKSQSNIKDWVNNNIDVIEKLGYKDADAFTDAFINATNEAFKAFENILKGKSQQVKGIFNNLKLDNTSLDVQKQIANKLQIAFNKGGIEAADKLGQFYQKAINSKSFDKIKDLKIDFDNLSVQQFQKKLKEAGITTSFSTEQLQAYILAQKQVAQNTRESLQKQYADVRKILDNLKDDGSISSEDATTLKSAGIELDNYFTHMLDGSYKLNTTAKEFFEYANNQSLEGFKARLEQLKQSVQAGANVQNSRYSSQSFSNFSSIALQEGEGEEGLIINQEKLNIQLDYLTLLNNESQVKKQIEEQGYATVKQATQLSEEVKKYATQYQNIPELIRQQNKEIEETEKGLKKAARAAKQLDKDVNKEKWKQLSDYFSNTKVEGYSERFKEDRDAAQDLAEQLLRFSSAVETVKKNYKEWSQILGHPEKYNEAQQALVKSEAANVYADTLGVDTSIFGDDFLGNVKNLELLNDVLTGTKEQSIEAYNELQKLAYLNILTQVGLDDSQFNEGYDNLKNRIDNFIKENNIEIGASIDNKGFIEALNQILTASNYTKKQAQAILKSFGVTAEVKPTKKTVFKNPIQIPTWHIEYQDTAKGGQTSPDQYDSRWSAPHRKVVFDGYKTVYQTQQVQGWSIGGQLYRDTDGGAKYTPTTPSSSGGGGGGGSSSKPSQAKTNTSKRSTTKKEKTYDPYEKVTKAYEKQSHILDRLQKQQDKLTGKDRLNNLQKQNKTLEKQNALLRKRQQISDREITRNTTAWFKKQLTSNDTIKDVIQFDNQGRVTNTSAILNAAVDAYNKAIKASDKKYNDQLKNYNNWIEKTYNKAKTKDDQEKLEKEKESREKKLKEAEQTAKNEVQIEEKKYKQIEEYLKEYERTWQDDFKAQQDWIQNLEQLIENKLSKAKIVVDLAIDTGNLERDFLDFQDKFIKPLKDEDLWGQAQSNARKMMSYFDSKEIIKTRKAMDDTRKTIDKLQKANEKTNSNTLAKLLGISKEDVDKLKKGATLDGLTLQDLIDNAIGMNQQKMREYFEQLSGQLEEVQQYVDSIKENYLSAIDAYIDAMDKHIEQYDRVNSIIEHARKMGSMMFGDYGFEQSDKLYTSQIKNFNRQTEVIAKYRDELEKKLSKARTEEEKERYKEQIEELNNQIRSNLENVIDAITARYEARMDHITQTALDTLYGGNGQLFANEQWDDIQAYDKDFLDRVESTLGIDQIERLYQGAIDGVAGNIAEQNKLKKVMNDQLKILREKEHLTQYDLDRAKAVLQVEQARMALEDARNQKNTMRLRRDSQGNYTYQYVADEEKLDDLQQKLADAQLNLYQSDKQHYIKNLNEIQQATEDYAQRRKYLEMEYQKAKQAGDQQAIKNIQARMDLLDREHQKRMEGLLEDNQTLIGIYLPQSYGDALKLDGDLLTTMKNDIPGMSSSIQQLADNLIGKGGLVSAFKDMTNQFNTAGKNWASSVKNALDKAGLTTDDYKNRLASAIKEVTDEIPKYKEIVSDTEKQIENIGKLLQQTNSFLEKVRDSSKLVADMVKTYNELVSLNETSSKDAGSGTALTYDQPTTQDSLITTINKIIKNFFKENKAVDKIAGYATGGYTGTWGEEGKLAFLHQKELVLNAEDTSNLLKAVYLVKDLTANMQIGKELSSLQRNQSALFNNMMNNHDILDQNVHIEASFPNVRDHQEIEQAFNNLVNMASMYASKKED